MTLLTELTKFVMPIILLAFALVLVLSKKNLLDSFVKGAREGMECCVNLLPTLLLVMCGVSALFSSGAVDVLCNFSRPLLSAFGVPEEMLPSIILRPFSGSGVTAVADRMFRECGPDSVPSKIACLLMGSTDTIIYTLSLYFSAAKIKRTRYATLVSFVAFVFSIVVCTLVGRVML